MKVKALNQSVILFTLLWTFGAVAVVCSGYSPAATPTAAPTRTLASIEYWPTSGWRTSTPEEQGMDSQKLALMLEAVKQQNLNLHSLVIPDQNLIIVTTAALDGHEEIYRLIENYIVPAALKS